MRAASRAAPLRLQRVLIRALAIAAIAALAATLCVQGAAAQTAAVTAASAGAAATGAAGPAALRRFALVMGANGGGGGRARLRYAVSDARAFAAVLTELGGVAAADLVLLTEPGLAAFRDAARRIEAVMASAWGGRCEFLFYYSGHSDEAGLLLGRERLGYTELRAAIERVPADLRVAILDSCSSGALTRAKGGSPRPAFLFDASSDMKGHAYLTSSSATEAAQESDGIGGSFFTHHLISALRGAADGRGTGRVTLNDAYAYAFRETLASTVNTRYGPQHPAYEINLTGTGDLVVTDLRSSRSGLAFSEELAGALYVRDSRGVLAVELGKSAGDRMEVGLPPGAYTVAMAQGKARFLAEVLVGADSRATLGAADFRPVAAGKTAARGLAVRPSTIAGIPVSFGLTVLPDLSRGLFASEEDKVVSLNVLWGEARDIRGVQLSTLANADSGDLHGFQFAGLANAVRGRAGGVQYAPIANVALGGFGGAQVLGMVNVAGASSVGVQLGLVNVASTMTGAQIGLVNVSDRIDGMPVGLVNIERGGILSPQLWTDGASSIRVGLAFGTRVVYTVASAGLGIGALPSGPSVGLGMGARLSVGPIFGDIDLAWRELFGDSGRLDFSRPSTRLEARALVGFPAKGPGLIAGCALEAYLPELSRGNDGSAVAAFRVEPRLLFGVKL